MPVSERAFRRRYINRRSSVEKRMFSSLSKVMQNHFIRFASTKKLPSAKTIVNDLKRVLSPQILNVIKEGVKFGLQDVEEQYGKPLPIFTEKVVTRADVETLGLTTTLNGIRDEGLSLVTTVSKSAVARMKTVYESGIAQNLSQEKITDLLMAEAHAGYPRYAARRIAQTETTRAFNAGTLAGYEKSSVTKARKWMPYEAKGHRDWHSGIEDAPIGKPFIVMGEELRYPADLNGSAINTVNCIPGNTNVFSFSPINKSMKRKYKGELITIETSSGNKLSASPNHPVLTLDGWFPIKFLKKGSNIVCCSFTEEMGFGNPDIDNSPSSIEKVFSSLSSVFKPHRSVCLDMDFHGDGKAGNVDIVDTDCLLEGTRDSSFFEPRFEKGFPTPFETFGSLFSDGSFAEISDSSFTSPDCTMGFTSNEVPVFRGGFRESVQGCLATPSDCNVILDESCPDCTSINFQTFCNSLLGFSRGITIDYVTDIKIESFHDLLYNLEVSDGWYVANDNSIQSHNCNVKGIVVHNCKCGTIPIIGIPEERPEIPAEEITGIPNNHIPATRGFREADFNSVRDKLKSGVRIEDLSGKDRKIADALKAFTDGSSNIRRAYANVTEGRSLGILEHADKVDLNRFKKQGGLIQRACLSNKLEEGEKLYRGFYWDAFSKDKFDDFIKLAKGGNFETFAPSSFTGDLKIAKQFAMKGKFKVRMVLDVGDDVYGIDVSSASTFAAEQETILAAGQKFAVKNVKKISDNEYVVNISKKAITKAVEKENFSDIMDELFNKPLSDRKGKK